MPFDLQGQVLKRLGTWQRVTEPIRRRPMRALIGVGAVCGIVGILALSAKDGAGLLSARPIPHLEVTPIARVVVGQTRSGPPQEAPNQGDHRRQSGGAQRPHFPR